jgi:hypothetical protein
MLPDITVSIFILPAVTTHLHLPFFDIPFISNEAFLSLLFCMS